MAKNVSENVPADPLALRLNALAGLMDHVIASLRKRTERLRDLRAALAIARDGDAPTAEPQTGVRRRDHVE